MFVNDLILFGEANIETILVVKVVLHDFSMKSGLFSNLEKCTHASLGMHLVRPEMLFLLPLPISDCLGSYLGCFFLDKRPPLSALQEITHKISQRPASWKSKLLSKAGRFVLINSVLNTFSSYLSLHYVSQSQDF